MKNIKITIAWLYPNLMSIYGDYGNLLTLQRRMQWRDIKVEVLEINFDNTKDLTKADIILMGGGQDRQQAICAKDLIDNKKKYLVEAHQRNIPALFACGGYQLMGHFYHPLSDYEIKNFDPENFRENLADYKFVPGQGADLPGLGIFDIHTVHYGKHKPRCIGNIATTIHNALYSEIQSMYEPKTNNQKPITSLVGFENHGGRTYFMKTKNQFNNTIPLGKVLKGWGNNGEDDTEGAISNNFIGTYLHGFLIKNSHIADWLIWQALRRVEPSRGFNPSLKPLNDTLEWETHRRFLKQVL